MSDRSNWTLFHLCVCTGPLHVATNTTYGDWCRRSVKRMPAQFRKHIELNAFSDMAEVSLPIRPAARTVFVSRLGDLPEQGVKQSLKAVGESRHLLFLSGLPIEAMPARLLQLDIRNPHRLHLVAEQSTERFVELIYRLVSGLADTNAPDPIVDAWVEGRKLVLLSPSFDRMSVPLEKLAKLIGTESGQIEAFEIDEDGRFLYWPHADVHLGWEQLKHLIDPASAIAAKQRSRKFNERYGEAIRAVRNEYGVTQSDVEGVSERHLRRIEHGELPASKAVLEAMAKAQGLHIEDYLKKLSERMR